MPRFVLIVVSFGMVTAHAQVSTSLRTTLGVWDVTTSDLNGDGQEDLLAITCDEHSYPLQKQLEVFLSRPGGSYATKPVTLDLDPAVSVAFLSEIDGTEPAELVLADHAGAKWFEFRDGTFIPRGEAAIASLLPAGAKRPLFMTKAVHDLDGDGLDEWLIPVGGAYEIWRAEKKVARVPAPIVSETQVFGSVVITHQLPALETFDLPDQATKGIAFLSDEFADFSYGADWSEHKRYRVPLNLDEKWEASTRLKDINADGFPDLIVTQTEGTLNMRVLTQIYIAEGPFQYPEEPTARFDSKGALTVPSVYDLDGDEQQDIVFISVPLSVRSIINYFLRNKVTVTIDAYMFDERGFSEKPDHRTTLTVQAPEGREQVAWSLGDFNGDGRTDLALGRNAEELAVYPGKDQALIATRPSEVIQTRTFGVARTYNLNGNGADDIVIYHPGLKHQKRIEIILF